MVDRICNTSVDKYRLELIEILDELVDYKPSLFALIGSTCLFNWRSLFDFSSEAWTEFGPDNRTTVINALAEKGSLFIALVTYKTMYIEMDRSDIAAAAGLSLARFLEDLVDPGYLKGYDQYDVVAGEKQY